MMDMRELNNNPQLDILKHSVKTLTKDWSKEEQESFSKQCFDEVCTDRYIKRRQIPTMNITIVENK